MADYIPVEIQAKIIKSLPIRSLIRFRSVSKPWKSLIDSFEVMVDYHYRQRQPHQRLLVSYFHPDEREIKYYTIVDDDTFPRRKVPLRVPWPVKRLYKPRIIGSSQGLICFYGSGDVTIWNPSITKSVAIWVPILLGYCDHRTAISFGVCPQTNDTKLVKITFPYSSSISFFPWIVEGYKLSSRGWRGIYTNLPCKSVALTKSQVVIDGVIYWHAYDRIPIGEGSRYMIISFDVTSEEFREIHLPCNVARSEINLFLFPPTNSLALEAYYGEVCEVWMMDHGVSKSFSKLFSIKAPNNSVSSRVLEFRKNGEPIMQTRNKSNKSVKLEVYKPYSKSMNDLGINRNSGSFFVTSYTETLLLLNEPDTGYSLMDVDEDDQIARSRDQN